MYRPRSTMPNGSAKIKRCPKYWYDRPLDEQISSNHEETINHRTQVLCALCEDPFFSHSPDWDLKSLDPIRGYDLLPFWAARRVCSRCLDRLYRHPLDEDGMFHLMKHIRTWNNVLEQFDDGSRAKRISMSLGLCNCGECNPQAYNYPSKHFLPELVVYNHLPRLAKQSQVRAHMTLIPPSYASPSSNSDSPLEESKEKEEAAVESSEENEWSVVEDNATCPTSN